MKRLQGLDYLRTQTNYELHRIIRLVTKMKAAGYTPLNGAEHDKEDCQQVLDERAQDSSVTITLVENKNPCVGCDREHAHNSYDICGACEHAR